MIIIKIVLVKQGNKLIFQCIVEAIKIADNLHHAHKRVKFFFSKTFLLMVCSIWRETVCGLENKQFIQLEISVKKTSPHNCVVNITRNSK